MKQAVNPKAVPKALGSTIIVRVEEGTGIDYATDWMTSGIMNRKLGDV